MKKDGTFTLSVFRGERSDKPFYKLHPNVPSRDETGGVEYVVLLPGLPELCFNRGMAQQIYTSMKRDWHLCPQVVDDFEMK